jgi:hypothetical protein
MRKAKTQAETKAKIIFEAYPKGTRVYAISRWHFEGAPTDHLAIYEAVVDCFTYESDGLINYYLDSPRGFAWGSEVESKYVSTNFNDLLDIAKELWSNNNEDENKEYDSKIPF